MVQWEKAQRREGRRGKKLSVVSLFLYLFSLLYNFHGFAYTAKLFNKMDSNRTRLLMEKTSDSLLKVLLSGSHRSGYGS